MLPRDRRTISAPTVAAVTTVLAALTPVTASAAADPLQRYGQQKLRWERCDAAMPAGFECTTVKVPLDYAHPGGRAIDLAVSRLGATDPGQRRGVLLANPGGPGVQALDLPLELAALLPAEVRQRYDLVGLDPRGVGRSTPIGCGLTADEQSPMHAYRPETFGQDVARARSVADKCRAAAGDLLPHLNTRNTARDLDVVRAALGERKISYYGMSYGTYLGAVYAQLFPQRVDRMVLDSALDPALVWRGTLRAVGPEVEAAFARWAGWAAARDAEYGLGATPEAVRQTYRDLVARADRTPIPTVQGAVDGTAIRSRYAQFAQVAAVTGWIAGLKAAAEGGPVAPPAPASVAEPAAASTGEPVPEAGGVRTAGVFGRAVPADNGTALTWAVLCGDARDWPRDPEQYRRDAVRDGARYPLMGDLGANVRPCAFWKPAPAEPPTVVNNTVGALILQNRWDLQATPAMAQGMRRAMRGARTVTVAEGEGHGVIARGPSCADASFVRYLTTGRLPVTDTTC